MSDNDYESEAVYARIEQTYAQAALHPMEAPTTSSLTLQKGCRCYVRGYTNWLYLAEWVDSNHRYCRMVDATGYTVFLRVAVTDLWHQGPTHRYCAGEHVKDKEEMLPVPERR